MLQAGLQLLAEHSTPDVLQKIVELAAELTGAKYAALGVIDSHGHISDFLTTGLSDEERARIGALPEGHGLLGALIEDPEPVRIPDISRDLRSYGFPPNHPPMRTFLGVPVRARGEVFGNIYVTEKQDGAEFTRLDQETLVLLAAQAGAAIENARLFETNELRQRRLEIAGEIAAATLEMEVNEVLALVAARAREMISAELVTVAVLEPDRKSLLIVAADGSGAEALEQMRIEAAGSLVGRVAWSGEPVIVDAAPAAPEGSLSGAGGSGGPAMVLPLAAGGQVFGALCAGRYARARPFTADDLVVIKSVATQAAVALEFGRTQEQLRRLAVLEDRERIARDLHDGAIQALFVVGMNLQAAAVLAGSQDMARRLDTAVDDLDRVILELRNYIFGLRTGSAGPSLEQGILRLASEFEERTEVVTVVEIDSEVAAQHQSSAGDLLHLVREALSNVQRHAKATTCRISLVEQEGRHFLEIDDDGRGFDVAASTPGVGLTNLRERAARLGGEVEIRSDTELGTTLRVVMSHK